MGELKHIVEELEGRSNLNRRKTVKRHLEKRGIKYSEQRFWLGTRSNIYADITGKKPGCVLIAAHYDRISESPGANDNASAVAAAIGAAEELIKSNEGIGVRVVFFDLEETNMFGPLAGSRNYVKRTGVNGVDAVLNMELVGEGTIPAFWPIRCQSERYKNACYAAAKSVGEKAHFIDYVVENTGDHESFSEAGLADSACLTMICEEDSEILRMVEQTDAEDIRSDPSLFIKLNQEIFLRSKTFMNYHGRNDTSRHIREESLQKAKQIILKFVSSY